jgi:hypothetical protein
MAPMWIIDKVDVNMKPLGVPYFRDATEGHSYENLRENPTAIDQLPEPCKAPALYDFVKEINSSASIFQTFGCEKWQTPWSHPQFPDFPVRSGSYTDIAFADVNRCRSQEPLWKLIADYRVHGPRCVAYDTVHINFEIRASVNFEWGNWWTLEFWNYGIGRNETEAEHWWAEGMRCFKEFLLEQSA